MEELGLAMWDYVVESYWFWKDKENDEDKLCIEYLNKHCESITEFVSIIEPEIDNSTAIIM